MLDLKNNGMYTITIKEPHKGETYTWELHWEGDAWDWYDLFKKIMYTVGYHPNTIKEVLPEEE